MNPDLQAAVERLEAMANIATHAVVSRDGQLHEARYVELADLRLVLDALKEARTAFADYKQSEGCDCCRDEDAHDAAETRLAAALGCQRYPDGSGWYWRQYRTKETPQ